MLMVAVEEVCHFTCLKRAAHGVDTRWKERGQPKLSKTYLNLHSKKNKRKNGCLSTNSSASNPGKSFKSNRTEGFINILITYFEFTSD